MTVPESQPRPGLAPDGEAPLFRRIAEGLRGNGYVVCPGGLPPALCQALLAQLHATPGGRFAGAGVGRELDRTVNQFVRTDAICWITGESGAGEAWLGWAERLRAHLNRELLLGLFSFESHFAHYRPGDFYRKHSDAFRGEANRVLSLVAYLNPAWSAGDGGELLMYLDGEGGTLKVTPALGTLVVFLSEDFPHEVLPARRDRYSIAGWYRVNGSRTGRADPPS